MSLQIKFLLCKYLWDTFNIELFLFYAAKNISIENIVLTTMSDQKAVIKGN